MTQKAFLFDLDGVLVFTEPRWVAAKEALYKKILGPEIANRMGTTTGFPVDAIYERAKQLGAAISKEEMKEAHMQVAPLIYDDVPIMEKAAELGALLKRLGYAIGVVTTSPHDWTDRVLHRLPFSDDLQVVVNLPDMPNLALKPAPDGYLYAMRTLGATPESTVILEDSNLGITAAKASGAFTIAFGAYLVPGYEQIAGDTFAATTDDVMAIVQAREA